MIVKKIQSDKVKTKAVSIRDLVVYIRKSDTPAKVMYAGGRGFLSESPAAQREEMMALAAEAVRSKNPVTHYGGSHEMLHIWEANSPHPSYGF